jgi:hypothetical protein
MTQKAARFHSPGEKSGLDDIRAMQGSIAGGRTSSAAEKSNNDQMGKLVAWWHDKPYPTGRERAIPAPDHLQQTEIEASSELTPYAENRLATAISRFREYLHKLGFNPKKGSVKVYSARLGLAQIAVGCASA